MKGASPLVGHMLQISPTTWKCSACCKKEWDLRKQRGIVEMNKPRFYCQIIIKIIVPAPTSSLILLDDPETHTMDFLPARTLLSVCFLGNIICDRKWAQVSSCSLEVVEEKSSGFCCLREETQRLLKEQESETFQNQWDKQSGKEIETGRAEQFSGVEPKLSTSPRRARPPIFVETITSTEATGQADRARWVLEYFPTTDWSVMKRDFCLLYPPSEPRQRTQLSVGGRGISSSSHHLFTPYYQLITSRDNLCCSRE